MAKQSCHHFQETLHEDDQPSSLQRHSAVQQTGLWMVIRTANGMADHVPTLPDKELLGGGLILETPNIR